jgi:hypothetical protein
MNRISLLGTIGVFLACAIGIIIFAFGPFEEGKSREHRPTRVVIPRETGGGHNSAVAEQMAWEDSVSIKVPLNDGEIAVSVLNQDLDGDSMEEQIVAFRNLLEIESPISITCIGYDERSLDYRRLWSAPTAATRPGTVSLFTMDLTGDRSACVIITGMNSHGEHTMTIFRQNAQTGSPFAKIAEIRIDGSITVQEIERSQAYHQGITKGQAYTIAAYGHDRQSANILDQIETLYIYNPASGLYEQGRETRIPGSQIEQRRLRELLGGGKGVFENFINDLWYYVSPQGTIDKSQYLYFDPVNREIIFFGDETQQVFSWMNSNPTRYGLYISSQNISVTTLRRFLDIELESLDRIKMRVFEDVRLKIAVSASWDGSYRRAGNAARRGDENQGTVSPFIDAMYDSALGRLRFFRTGAYELSSSGTIRKGRYVFFRINGQELLELRAGTELNGGEPKAEGSARLVYLVDPALNDSAQAPASFSLSRVRLGAMGIQDLHEGQILLSIVQ